MSDSKSESDSGSSETAAADLTQRDLRGSEPLPDEQEAFETVSCDGYCGGNVFKAGTVDVAVGALTGTQGYPEPSVTMTGVVSGQPELQYWCLSCAEEQFGVETSADSRRVEAASMYITSKTVAALTLGLTIGLLMGIMFVI